MPKYVLTTQKLNIFFYFIWKFSIWSSIWFQISLKTKEVDLENWVVENDFDAFINLVLKGL